MFGLLRDAGGRGGMGSRGNDVGATFMARDAD